MIVKQKQSSITPIVVAAQQGDRDAMGELYNRSVCFCYKRLKEYSDDHNTICDMMSEVWMIVLRKLNHLATPGAFFSWLKQVNHSCACNYVSRGRLMIPLSDHIDPSQPLVGQDDQSDILSQLLSRMCRYDQEVITYFYFDHLSIKKIAKKLRCPASTVRRRLFTARNRLRKMITADPECRRELLAILGIEE